MIAGLSTSGALQSLYPQYNKKRVSGVKKVHRQTDSSKTDSTSDVNATPEDTTVSNYAAALLQEAEEQELQYDPENPYSCSKKILDQSLLLGAHIDEQI